MWPFDIVATRRGAFWALTDEERDKLAIALARVGVKWMPTWLEAFGEECALIGCVAMIAWTRYCAEQDQAERMKDAKVESVETTPEASSAEKAVA